MWRELLKNYSYTIEKEIEDIITKIIKILNEQLLPDALDSEAKVFYFKMVGDCNRYRAELIQSEESELRIKAIKLAIESFQLASECAVKELSPLNAIR